MEFELDCESRELVFNSLCNGFDCDPNYLEKILLEIDIDKICAENWMKKDFPDAKMYLYDYVNNKLGKHKPLKQVNWFHMTRTSQNNEFKDGIHPLGEVLERIWMTLLNISPNTLIKKNLISLKNSGIINSHYLHKTKNKTQWGPFAYLVKDAAFSEKGICNHDYLKMPEIICDICDGYKEKFGESIINIYETCLVPKIVKFRSSKQLDTSCIRAALYYAYEMLKGKLHTSDSVAYFNGDGSLIMPDDIISVTSLKD